MSFYDTDFGRIGCWICADETHVEIARVLHVLGGDLLFVPTQSWSPDGGTRECRDISRAMNAGVFLIEATQTSSEPTHASKIIDPCGRVVVRSPYFTKEPCMAEIDLDAQAPARYLREWTCTQSTVFAEHLPTVKKDLFAVIRAQRRPELYRPILFPR